MLSTTTHTIRVDALPKLETLVGEHNAKISKLNKRHSADLTKMSFKILRTREVTSTEVSARLIDDEDAATRCFHNGYGRVIWFGSALHLSRHGGPLREVVQFLEGGNRKGRDLSDQRHRQKTRHLGGQAHDDALSL